MFCVVVFILLVFLLVRAVLWLVQRHHDAHGSGREFDRLLSEGLIDSGVFAGATWSERTRFGKRRRRALLAREQRRFLRDTKRFFRNQYLEVHPPSIYQLIVIFLIASVLGLVLETVYTFVVFGIVESRVGLVWGPFSPLYGVGAVLLTVCLWSVRDRAWWQVFLLSAVLGGALEQAAGWSMAHFADAQSWTYLGLPDHITQWVAVRFLVMWGVVGLAWCKLIMPELIYRIGEPDTRQQKVIVGMLGAFLALDIAMTFACFYRAAERAHDMPADGPFEAYVDAHFGDAFMARKFENMRIGADLPPSPR